MRKKRGTKEKTPRIDGSKKKTFVQFKCARCMMCFSSRVKLKHHSQKHTDALKELELLRQGHIPDYNKIGSEFKGKNRIIIT